ncbi:serine hydrolase domain-containing protein [Botrimarina mediterranea]|uniref:Penicillin-binding protein 4 n=1 Tax=Botrimarina mediterranea TaxID=2528022 RepID=A0A518KCI3_9BACT|nr:serine hydrolase domain-containing protein [Botrimarina mediterranea]QDV75510.1 Penicillin-binding protein 4* [Botrimarina mediterranea]QDV80143.1 Penicillin-binding protein 4* [Planctomycetes bacterium K2D]
MQTIRTLITIGLVATAAALRGDENTISIPPEPPGGTVYQRVKQMLPPHVGCAVMVFGKGASGKPIVFKHGYGACRYQIEDGSKPEPITPATTFRVASFTKVLTAAAVLKLVDDEKLLLEDSALKWLPGLPETFRPVTIGMMLDHTSGLPPYHGLLNIQQLPEATDLNVLRTLSRLPDAALTSMHPRTTYNNTAYVLLGLVVQQASGQPFADYLRDEVLHPAGMEGSLLFVEGLNSPPNRAFGHQPGPDIVVQQTRQRLQQMIALRERIAQQQAQPNAAIEQQILMAQRQLAAVPDNADWHEEDQGPYTRLGGDGALYTSLNDLEAFLHAVRDRKVPLSEAGYDLWMTPRVSPPENDGFGDSRRGRTYACGWMVDERLGEPRYSHRGATKGFRQTIQWLPENDRAVVVLMNSVPPGPEGPESWDDALIEALGERVMQVVLGE